MLGGILHARSASRRLTLVVAAATTLVVPLFGAPVLGSTLAPRSAGAGDAGRSNLTATSHDLGTLGGRSSEATAVDGTVVVGQSRTASHGLHAFAYDLAAEEPAMIDLGSLAGGSSGATDVDGSVVVGVSSTGPVDEFGDPVLHAFAYDLAAEAPTMVDLGTLGGDWSSAEAVDNGVVVGTSGTASGGWHAFAYDLTAHEPTMVDLGALGGRYSTAHSVDDGIVVGRSDNAAGEDRAFAYDLTAAQPVMQDLGTLDGGRWSEAQDVDGAVIVGGSTSPVPGQGRRVTRAVAYDLGAADPVMQDFTTLAALSSTVPTTTNSLATGVSGDIVIGHWGVSLQNRPHGFAQDLAEDDPRTLGLGGWRGSKAVDVDGDVVVGENRYGGATRATAWTLRQTTRPMLAFRHVDHPVKEGVGRVAVRVDRYGRTDRAVTVRYRTRSDRAKAGKDFVSTSGKLHFARGVTSRRFTVRILNDRRAEYEEDLLLILSRPSRPALLGTPSWSHLRIRPNDR
jgi:probable HAF family extracellular repeat protein